MTLNRCYDLALVVAGNGERAQGHALVDLYIVADDGRLAYDHARAVVNEQAAAHRRTGMQVDAGNRVGVFAHDARNERDTAQVKLVGYAVHGYGVNGRVAVDDFLGVGRRRVTGHGRLDIQVKRVPQAG